MYRKFADGQGTQKQRPEAEAPDRCFHRRGGENVPTRTPELDSRAGNRAVLAAGVLRGGRPTALLPSARRSLCGALLELFHVRVELGLIFRRQRGAKVILLRLEQRLDLLAL